MAGINIFNEAEMLLKKWKLMIVYFGSNISHNPFPTQMYTKTTTKQCPIILKSLEAISTTHAHSFRHYTQNKDVT